MRHCVYASACIVANLSISIAHPAKDAVEAEPSLVDFSALDSRSFGEASCGLMLLQTRAMMLEPDPGFQQLPDVSMLLSNASSVMDAVQREAEDLEARVAQAQAQNAAKLANKKTEYQQRLLEQEKENREVVQQNAELSEDIKEAEKINQDLEQQLAQIKERSASLKSKVAMFQTKLGIASNLTVEMLVNTDHLQREEQVIGGGAKQFEEEAKEQEEFKEQEAKVPHEYSHEEQQERNEDTENLHKDEEDVAKLKEDLKKAEARLLAKATTLKKNFILVQNKTNEQTRAKNQSDIVQQAGIILPVANENEQSKTQAANTSGKMASSLLEIAAATRLAEGHQRISLERTDSGLESALARAQLDSLTGSLKLLQDEMAAGERKLKELFHINHEKAVAQHERLAAEQNNLQATLKSLKTRQAELRHEHDVFRHGFKYLDQRVDGLKDYLEDLVKSMQ